MRGLENSKELRHARKGLGKVEHASSDDSNSNSNGVGDSGNSGSGGDDSNSDSGGGDSDSGRKNNNQLKPAAEKAAIAVDAALASVLLAS